MGLTRHWRKESGARVQGARPLDRLKVQAPCVVKVPEQGYRLFYTAVGPAKPYAVCQGYILSAFSEDGLAFHTEPGIRLAPQPSVPHMALRTLAPTVNRCDDGRWRMYFEARGSADLPPVICSAVSEDLLHWVHEEGIRLEGYCGVGGPRYVSLPDGGGRIYCFATERASKTAGDPTEADGCAHDTRRQSIISAVTSDGLSFIQEPGCRMRDRQSDIDSAGITAAEVISPQPGSDKWAMYYSAWQDVAVGTDVPLHPSRDPDAASTEDFAAASIASDMAGFRSRIFVAYSRDGLEWERGDCIVEGGGYDSDELDAVHAEDMSLVEIGNGQLRMYYAACDRTGTWRVLSAAMRGASPPPERPTPVE